MRIVFVCTGNICRSPTAEGVLRHKLAAAGLDGEHTTDSYGLGGWHVGDPPDSRAIAAAARRGYDLTAIRARQFEPEVFHDAGLVLAMDRGHQRQLAALAPEGGAEKLFRFLEFAPQTAAGGAALDVPDPYYGDAAGFEEALDLIEAGAEGLLEDLKKGLA